MIVANEIRIGNILYSNLTKANFVVTVDDIVSISKDPRVANPVSLSSEILEKAGLKQNLTKTAWWDKEEKILIAQTEDELGTKYQLGTWVGIRAGTCDEPEIETLSKEIGYLHQLQNLYFDLTGEELNLKL